MFNPSNTTGQTFSSLNQIDETCEHVDFDDCRFIGCDFQSARFEHCTFTDCRFERCNLSLCDFPNTRFTDVQFVHCKCTGIDWTHLKWPSIPLASPFSFEYCQLNQGYFFELALRELVMEHCDIQEADFRGADLSHSSFANSDLTNALFLNTTLQDCNFIGATNYCIDPGENDIKKAAFAFPEVIGLLHHLDIHIQDFS